MSCPIEKSEVVGEVELRAHSAYAGTRVQNILKLAVRILKQVSDEDFHDAQSEDKSMSGPASFPLDSYECLGCHIYSHYTPPLDNKIVPKTCPYCSIGVLVWRTDNNWKLMEVI